MHQVETIGPSANAPASGSDAASSCRDCRAGSALPFDFSSAFQPIVDLETRSVFAFEALVRGPAGEGAASVFAQINDGNRYAFDQAARRRAIELACERGLHESGARLSINFMPNAMYEPARCVRSSLAAAKRAALDPSRLIFEMVEHEQVGDPAKAREIFRVYREHGMSNALDDFGAGHSGLVLLTELEPDIIKLDMALIRDIDSSARKRSIVAAMVGLCRDLGIRLIAEGIETKAEAATLRGLGIDLMQGYLFGRPAFERLEPPLL